MILMFINTKNYQISKALFIVDMNRPFNPPTPQLKAMRYGIAFFTLGVGVRDLYRATPHETSRLGF